MNIAETCFNKRTVTIGLALALAIAGVKSYFNLGRLEDPEFTIRCAQVLTSYPGATAQEVAERVSDPIEIAVQRLGRVKHVTSISYPGKSIVLVELKDECVGSELPQIWDELRRKVNDMSGSLPEGCSKPLVYDDYGDVYGVFYAISGDGYSYAELKDYAKLLRRELLLCTDVAKVDLLGDQQEIVEISLSRAKISALDIPPEKIAAALRGQSVPEDAGDLRVADKTIRISPTGSIRTVEDFGGVMVVPNVFLRDIATIRRTYADNPGILVKRNGRPSIGFGISTAKGGNVIRMGEAVERRMRELVSQTPIGIEVDVVSHQATSVKVAVNGFIENLVESVVLVIAVLLFTMGLRSGLLIGGVLILTVLATVFVMDLCGILFERISLGAFIIALGMLVDNAIVITEAVLVAANRGESKKDAAIAVVKQTQWALLGGTAIAILSFAPIGASQNASGEYCRSLFLVIGISLLLSWVLAITVTPLLAAKFLEGNATHGTQEAHGTEDPYGGLFFRAYRGLLEWCVTNRGFTLFALVCLLVGSVIGFGRVKQNFFPDSTRPQFMVHVWMPEGTFVPKTDERVQAVAEAARKLPGVTGVSTFTGGGAMRFLLTYTPEDSDSAYGLVLVDVENDGQIAGLMKRIEDVAPDLVPDAMVTCQRFVLGPGDPQKIQMRIRGNDPKVLRALGEKAIALLRADPNLKEVQSDWRNPADVSVPQVSDVRARKLGLSRSEIARAFRVATAGVPIGTYLEGDEQLPIVLRSPVNERGEIVSAFVWSDLLGESVPIAQVLECVGTSSEEMRLRRRDQKYCLTVKCNPVEGQTAAEAFDRIKPALDALGDAFPSGTSYEYGGEYENSKEANETLVPTFVPILAAMVLTVLMLFNSVKKTLVIFLTLPLILVGVVAGLLAFGQPFGFMALLGFLSLVGMQVKNAIVLMDEITANMERGLAPYAAVIDAGVSRLRPVANASLTTVLGMLPLLTDAFYAAMAVTIMAGLAFATVLTMVVIPVNYALLFRIRKETQS